VATDREDVANDNEVPHGEGTERQRRLRRGPVELRLPTRDQIAPERLDAAYRILVRFVAQQVRQARRDEAVNDQRTATPPGAPSGEDAA